jgi:putative alpha-1,2-mannosidase
MARSVALFLSLFTATTLALLNNSQHVNLFIGTEGPAPGNAWNGGNVFPGATFPFGAVKVGIDTTEYVLTFRDMAYVHRFNASTDANAGYTPDGNVTAITMMHVSGTGGAPKYGVIPQMPLTTLEGVNLLDNMTYMQPRVGRDLARIGLYRTKLANGVQVDLSSSMHAGLIQYLFPQAGEKHVMVDLSHYLPTQDDHMSSQFYVNSFMDLTGDKNTYSGYGTWKGGWNQGTSNSISSVAHQVRT